MKKILGLSAIVVLLFAGWGNEDGEPALNTNQYDLRTFFDTGSFSSKGKGTLTKSSNTVKSKGTYQNSYQGTDVVTSGETIHKHDIKIKLTDGKKTVPKLTESASYMGNFFVIKTDEYKCSTTLPLSDLVPLSSDAQVGYISNEVRLECDNGTYMTNAIKLKDAGGGNALISVSYNTYSSSDGTLLASETENIVVDSSMAIQDAEISAKLIPEDIGYSLIVKGSGPGGGGGGGGNIAPIADAGDDQSALVNEIVTLDGSESYDAENSILTYSWTLTNKPIGSTAEIEQQTSAIISFTADMVGIYTVELVVNDGKKDSISDKVIITVSSGIGNTSPTANAGPDKNIEVYTSVSIIGSGTDIDGTIVSYSWTKNGEVISVDPSFLYTPTSVGIDTFILTVTDNDGASASDSMQVIVEEASSDNQIPVADAGIDQNVLVFETVKLNASGSSDSDGDRLTYNWSFTSKPEGSSAVLTKTTTKRPTFVVDIEGTYILSLVVNDGTIDSNPDSVTVSTNISSNTAPIADAGNDQSVLVSESVTLNGTGSSDPDNDAITYSWSFTERPNGSSASLSSTSVMNPIFNADVEGTYVLSLIVHDGTINSSPDSVTVTATTIPNTALTFVNNTSFTIPDGGSISGPGIARSEIDVVGAADSITKITVTLDIFHQLTADLNIKLISPIGTSIVLSDVNIYYIQYTNTTFDDAAVLSITEAETGNLTGSYRPVESLATFDGEGADGTWTLQVEDTVWMDEGTLNSWSITIE